MEKRKDISMTQVEASVVKETEKAYQFNVSYWTQIDKPKKNAILWCPKSCCTIADDKTFIADFILNKWTEDYVNRISVHTTRIPNVKFDVKRVEADKAYEEEKKQRENKKYEEAKEKARPIADSNLRKCGYLCVNFNAENDDKVVNKEAVAELVEFGKKLLKKYGKPTEDEMRYDKTFYNPYDTDSYPLWMFALNYNSAICVEVCCPFRETYNIHFNDHQKAQLKLAELLQKIYG